MSSNGRTILTETDDDDRKSLFGKKLKIFLKQIHFARHSRYIFQVAMVAGILNTTISNLFEKTIRTR